MIKYKLKDGGTIIAVDSQDFVNKLRESSKFDSDSSSEEYMKNFAERYFIQTGNHIRFDTPDNFLADLKKVKYIV